MKIFAPAKINLTLDVLDRRADGYHNISSVMQTIGLCDELDVDLEDEPGDVHLSIVEGYCWPPISGLPTDHRNLAYRAATLFRSVLGLDRGVRIHLQKNIPLQAGLGGGSSDAAAVLTALNEELDEPLSREELVALGVKLGADVPFFLYGGTCLVEGSGERVTPLTKFPDSIIIVVKPKVGVSTVEAYRALDDSRAGSTHAFAKPWDGQTFRNDFEPIVMARYPEIAAARDLLLEAGCENVTLCGSGSAVFGIGDNRMSVELIISAYIAEHQLEWFWASLPTAGPPVRQ